MKKNKLAETASGMHAAASRLGVPVSHVRAAKHAGLTAFRANGSVRLSPVREWIRRNSEKLRLVDAQKTPRDELLREQIRKLRASNDREAAKLIDRQWVAERFARAIADLERIRERSLAEDPALFARAGSDVPVCRMEVKAFWDRVIFGIRGLGKHFEE